jgi:hypothetical protein
MYMMQRTTSGAAGNGLYTTIKYMRRAAGIGLGITIKYLRRTTSGAAGSSLGTMIKYLRGTTSAAANNGLSTTVTSPCIEASFVVNSEPHTGARPSIRLCVVPEFSCCVHITDSSIFPAARSRSATGVAKQEARFGLLDLSRLNELVLASSFD